jgi:alkanesulfonate monooxygenase SsuD/methylene tetrahydromethanopterin reductase-like flavin-dependent oxidoreductase (luciferase family)
VAATKRDLQALGAAARDAGRDPTALSFVQIRSAFPWDDGDAWDVVRDGLAHANGVYEGWDAGGDTPEKGFMLPEQDDDATRARTAVGTPHQVARALRPFADAFGGHHDATLVVRLHFPGMDHRTSSHAVELFGEHVIPALKGA